MEAPAAGPSGLESSTLPIAKSLPGEDALDWTERDWTDRDWTGRDGVDDGEAARVLPDAGPGERSGACRPFHAAGPVVACMQLRLLDRAAKLGWRLVTDAMAGLHLLVDGRRVEPEVRGSIARFALPADAGTVWLVTEAVVPFEIDGTPDHRELGVCIGRLAVDDGFAARIVAADDARLCVGFHEVEDGPQRWTAARARVPSDLFAHCRDGFFLRLEITRPALPRWTAPCEAAAVAG